MRPLDLNTLFQAVVISLLVAGWRLREWMQSSAALRIVHISAQLLTHHIICRILNFEFPSTAAAIHAASVAGILPAHQIEALLSLNRAANFSKHASFTKPLELRSLMKRPQKTKRIRFGGKRHAGGADAQDEGSSWNLEAAVFVPKPAEHGGGPSSVCLESLQNDCVSTSAGSAGSNDDRSDGVTLVECVDGDTVAEERAAAYGTWSSSDASAKPISLHGALCLDASWAKGVGPSGSAVPLVLAPYLPSVVPSIASSAACPGVSPETQQQPARRPEQVLALRAEICENLHSLCRTQQDTIVDLNARVEKLACSLRELVIGHQEQMSILKAAALAGSVASAAASSAAEVVAAGAGVSNRGKGDELDDMGTEHDLDDDLSSIDVDDIVPCTTNQSAAFGSHSNAQLLPDQQKPTSTAAPSSSASEIIWTR